MIAEKKRPVKRNGKNHNFILTDEVVADIELIAAYHAESSGTPATMSNGVRIAVRKEASRIKALQARKGKV